MSAPRYAQVADSLRLMADWLDAHGPDLPPDKYGNAMVDLQWSVATRDEVEAAAGLLGTIAIHHKGQTTAAVTWPAAQLRVSHVEDAEMARYRAAWSYDGAVTP